MNRSWMLRAILGVGAIATLAIAGAGCANNRPATCDPECPLVTHLCCGEEEPVCRNILGDAENCGACGRSCGTGVCRGGACVPAADGGVTPGADGSIPPVGDCDPECGSNFQCCNDSCVSRMVASGTDGRSDPSFMNCGTCGFACAADRASACSIVGSATVPSCVCGSSSQCNAGQTCVPEGSTFRCVSLSTDPMNCGEPGNACGVGEACVGGVCGCGSTGASCAAGQACCPGMGCIDTQSDEANCGACGTACGVGETCTAGACLCGTSPPCERPGMGSGGIPIPSCGEMCCGDVCVAHDATNCGTCGTACTGEDVCGTMVDLTGMGTGGPPMCGMSGGLSFFLECGGFGGL